ncbi:hypothetical protein [Halosolutus gelatinilyticus]|uniref:hypothetical protein n=1 Tax=Halosolutus gelatinilyticus TaxID=2931975 RepID=UPI001FF0E9EF|nr:hypothetical protein [Halosolutus gelatinilyticus]
MVCASVGVFAIANTGASINQPDEDDDENATEADEQDGGGNLQVTVENATIVVVGADHQLADEMEGNTGVVDDGALSGDNETVGENDTAAGTGDQHRALVHETSVEVTVEQASMLHQNGQNGVDAEDGADAEAENETDGETEGTAIGGDTEGEADENETEAPDAGNQELTIEEATIVIVLDDEMSDDGALGNETADGDLTENDTAVENNETDVGAEDNVTGVGVEDNETGVSVGDNETGVGINGATDSELSLESASVFVVVEEIGDTSGAESGAAGGIEDNETGVGSDGLGTNESDDAATGLEDNESGVTDDGLEDTGAQGDGDSLQVTIERATIVILVNDVGDAADDPTADEGVEDNGNATVDEEAEVGSNDETEVGDDDNVTVNESVGATDNATVGEGVAATDNATVNEGGGATDNATVNGNGAESAQEAADTTSNC